MGKFKAGDTAYIIESNRFVRKGVITSCVGGIYLFKYPGGGIRVKENRLFESEEIAKKVIDKVRPKQKNLALFSDALQHRIY